MSHWVQGAENDLMTETWAIYHVQSYLSRNPSASIVNKMENLLRTVNMGRLVEENISCHNKLSNIKLGQASTDMPSELMLTLNGLFPLTIMFLEIATYFSRLVPNRPVI